MLSGMNVRNDIDQWLLDFTRSTSHERRVSNLIKGQAWIYKRGALGAQRKVKKERVLCLKRGYGAGLFARTWSNWDLCCHHLGSVVRQQGDLSIVKVRFFGSCHMCFLSKRFCSWKGSGIQSEGFLFWTVHGNQHVYYKAQTPGRPPWRSAIINNCW